MMKLPITVIVAIKNEAKNLPKCLNSLRERFQKVILVDSNSNDGSDEIALRYGVELVQFQYVGGYPKKRQWALNSLDILSQWVLLLDADEEITDELFGEISAKDLGTTSTSAFYITKQFHFLGRELKLGGFSHSAILLFKKDCAFFEELVLDVPDSLDMEVHERLVVKGITGRLRNPLKHEDFKGLEAYINRHNKYSTWEARLRFSFLSSKLYGGSSITPDLFGDTQQRRRFFKLIAMRIPFESWAWFIYHYFLRLGFLEGRPGLIASQIRASYISQVRAKIYELKKNARL